MAALWLIKKVFIISAIMGVNLSSTDGRIFDVPTINRLLRIASDNGHPAIMPSIIFHHRLSKAIVN
jgi:hypothetical protein